MKISKIFKLPKFEIFNEKLINSKKVFRMKSDKEILIVIKNLISNYKIDDNTLINSLILCD